MLDVEWQVLQKIFYLYRLVSTRIVNILSLLYTSLV